MTDDTHASGQPSVLIVEDEAGLRRVMAYQCVQAGWIAVEEANAEAALGRLADRRFDVVLSDMKLQKMDGIQMLEKAREIDPDAVVVMITAHGTVEKAVEAMKAGAFDFLTKPIDGPVLVAELEKALAFRRLKVENRRLKERVSLADVEEIVGVSQAMLRCLEVADKAAPTEASVMITGESGTGKEVIAQAIHRKSARSDGPFVAINCAAIPADLLESELFGAAKGAYTGALRDKPGRLETARRGTLFLDEIGEMPTQLQPKLLRVLQERTVMRLGESQSRKVDFRLISATNADPEKLIGEGKFREDLYYRLNVIPLHLPPLRMRPEDIAPLVAHFTRRLADSSITWSKEAMEKMEGHGWPGNVRELANVVERVMILRKGDRIEVEDLPLGESTPDTEPPPTSGLAEAEAEMVRKALKEAGGNQSRAARALKIERHVLIYRMKKYRIPPYEKQ